MFGAIFYHGLPAHPHGVAHGGEGLPLLAMHAIIQNGQKSEESRENCARKTGREGPGMLYVQKKILSQCESAVAHQKSPFGGETICVQRLRQGISTQRPLRGAQAAAHQGSAI